MTRGLEEGRAELSTARQGQTEPTRSVGEVAGTAGNVPSGCGGSVAEVQSVAYVPGAVSGSRTRRAWSRPSTLRTRKRSARRRNDRGLPGDGAHGGERIAVQEQPEQRLTLEQVLLLPGEQLAARRLRSRRVPSTGRGTDR